MAALQIAIDGSTPPMTEEKKKIIIQETYQEMYPDLFNTPFPKPTSAFTLDEVSLRDRDSKVAPLTASLATAIGPIRMNLPIFSAAMDTVSGPELCIALAEVGGCGILSRTKTINEQMEWLKQVLEHEWCIVKTPKCLRPNQSIKDAEDMHTEFGFSTIPITDHESKLLGILFTKNINYDGNKHDSVSQWMKPIGELKTKPPGTSFSEIKTFITGPKTRNDTTLPVVDKNGLFHGIYFKKDFRRINPAEHLGKPLVGIAIGTHEDDLERARQAVRLGAGVIVIDSSHGNCPAVIEQVKRTRKTIGHATAIIAGNVASIEGYLNLMLAGVDGVKCGIGSGSICTTSATTGVGVPMWTLIREIRYLQKKLNALRYDHVPAIIPDGGLNASGQIVKALVSGGDAIMAGQLLVAASESIACVNRRAKQGDRVLYRGMASANAIKARSADARYGEQKTAAEGVEGWEICRGPLRTWINAEIELMQAGFAHIGAKNIAEAQRIGDDPTLYCLLSNSGQIQNSARVEQN